MQQGGMAHMFREMSSNSKLDNFSHAAAPVFYWLHGAAYDDSLKYEVTWYEVIAHFSCA